MENLDSYCALSQNYVDKTITDKFTSPKVVGTPIHHFEPRSIDWSRLLEGTSFRPDTVIDGWETDSFTVRGATLRGYDHRYYRLPRQDDFAIEMISEKDWIIAAVADGVSGAKMSHIGSTLVTRYVVKSIMSKQLNNAEDIESYWDDIFKEAAWALVERAKTIPNGNVINNDIDAEKTEELLATTLVCVVVAPSHNGAEAYIANVGDSGAWVADSSTFRKIIGGKASDNCGISSSAVSGLPRLPESVQSAKIELCSGQVLLLGSDGFGDPLGDGDEELGALFRGCLFPPVPSMLEFAHTLDFSRENFDDDRTLVAIWPKAKMTKIEPDNLINSTVGQSIKESPEKTCTLPSTSPPDPIGMA